MNVSEILKGLESELAEVSERLANQQRNGESTAETIEEVREIVAAAIDVLEEIDLSKLAESVDLAELAEAVDVDELPDAIAEHKPLDAIDLSELPDAIPKQKLLEAVDVLDLATEVGELKDEIDDVTEEDLDEMEADAVERMGISGGDLADVDPESIETAIQDAVLEAVERFREALMTTHAVIRKLVEENRERFDSVAEEQPRSRNPTAFSTMPARNATLVSTAVPSTIPRRVRHSSIVNKPQIYGRRFEREGDDG